MYKQHEETLIKHFGCIEEVDKIELRRWVQLQCDIQKLRAEMEGKEVMYIGNSLKMNPRMLVIREMEYHANAISKRLGLFLIDRETAKKKNAPKVEKPKVQPVAPDDDNWDSGGSADEFVES